MFGPDDRLARVMTRGIAVLARLNAKVRAEQAAAEATRRAEDAARLRYAIQHKATLDAWMRENNWQQRRSLYS